MYKLGIDIYIVCSHERVRSVYPCKAASWSAQENGIHEFGFVVEQRCKTLCDLCLPSEDSESSSPMCTTAKQIASKIDQPPSCKAHQMTDRYFSKDDSPVLLYSRIDTRPDSVNAPRVELTEAEITKIAVDWVTAKNVEYLSRGYDSVDAEVCSHTWTRNHESLNGTSAGVEEVVHLKLRGSKCRVEISSWNCEPPLPPVSLWKRCKGVLVESKYTYAVKS